jgi:hypothetical protein
MLAMPRKFAKVEDLQFVSACSMNQILSCSHRCNVAAGQQPQLALRVKDDITQRWGA